jgi:hypothetical protein
MNQERHQSRKLTVVAATIASTALLVVHDDIWVGIVDF